MANTITKAVNYINNQAEVLRMFNVYSLTNDLVKTVADHKGNVCSYDKIDFSNYVLGDFDRTNGYGAKDFTFTRVNKTLTQDKGDSLYVDTMDKDEAQIADGIVSVFNVYNVKVRIPAVDKYRFSKLAEGGLGKLASSSTPTANDILGKLLDDEAKIADERINFNECILYISTDNDALLKKANFANGYFSEGAWNGRIDLNTKMFDGAKYVVVPKAILGEGINWFIVHPLAFDALVIYQDNAFFDKVPGYGTRRNQIDTGIYHDAWIQPNGEKGVLANYRLTAKATLTANADHTISVSGIEGASFYYGNAAGVTDSGTAISGGKFTGTANTTYYVVMYVDGEKLGEASIKAI